MSWEAGLLEMDRPTLQSCMRMPAAAMAWACLREVFRLGYNSRGWALAGGDMQIQQAVDRAIALSVSERKTNDMWYTRPNLTCAYVDVHTARHCGVMLYGEGLQRPCAEVLPFADIESQVANWQRSLSSSVESFPPRCSEDERELCLEMDDTLNTLSFGWLLALQADLIRISAWKPWPLSLLKKYDLIIFRVDDLRLLQPLPKPWDWGAAGHGQLRLVVGSEPHLYGDKCDVRYRSFNDFTRNGSSERLHDLGFCPVLLDPFLIPSTPGAYRGGPVGLPHWWQLPLHIYGAVNPRKLSTEELLQASLSESGRHRVLVLATPSGQISHVKNKRKKSGCFEIASNHADAFLEELKQALPRQHNLELVDNWRSRIYTTWEFWKELGRVKYVVLLPVGRQSLGRAIAEAAAVTAVPVLGWRNKLFMRLLMPPMLSVGSVEEIVETIMRLESSPETYDALRRSIESRLRFVDPARGAIPGTSAAELVRHVGKLGAMSDLCQFPYDGVRRELSEPSDRTESRREAEPRRPAFQDPLQGAMEYARRLLCEPSAADATSFVGWGAGPRYCTHQNKAHIGWENRVLRLIHKFNIDEILQELAWRPRQFPDDGAVWSAMSCLLLHLAQISGEDMALALVFFRLAEKALQFASARRHTFDRVTVAGNAADSMYISAVFWHSHRNYSAKEWLENLRSNGGWTQDIDEWLQYEVSFFWDHV